MKIGKWISATQIATSIKLNLKTKRWIIQNSDNGSVLGLVKWYGPFRQYSFFPAPGELVFEKQCLRDLAVFLETQTKQYKINAAF